MKKMVLTGLATEQSFNSPQPVCYLVFNDGELKVPVSEEAAEAIVSQMYGKTEEPIKDDEETYGNGSYQVPTSEFQDEDGIDQI